MLSIFSDTLIFDTDFFLFQYLSERENCYSYINQINVCLKNIKNNIKVVH